MIIIEDSFATGYAVGADRSGSNDSFGFGNGGWMWIFLIFVLFGFGGRGFGGFGGGQDWQRSSVQDNYVLASDFANVERKIDGVNNGLCDGFYAMNTGMLNGFNGINAGMLNGFNGVSTGMMQQGYETRNAINGIGQQLANCCCEVREGIAGVNYNAAMNMNGLQKQISDCCCENRAAIAQVRYDMSQNTRDIVEASNANTRAILDYMCQKEINTLTRENDSLRLKASQAEQNSALIAALRPAPIPSYTVSNPYCCTPQPTCGCGYNS